MIEKFISFIMLLIGFILLGLVLYVWFEWNAYTADMSYAESIAPPIFNLDIILNFLEYLFDKWFG